MAEITAKYVKSVKGYKAYLGTLTDSALALDVTATWSDAAETFTLLKANVTNTNSAAASKLIDLQVGGVTQFNVTRAGVGTFVGGVTMAGLTCTTGAFGGAVSGITTLASGKHTITDATFSNSRRSSPSLQVANDGTATVSTTAFAGVLTVTCTDNGRSAIVSLNGGNGIGTLLLNDSSLYTTTAGTGSKVNIYESGGNFILQNKSGGTLNFRIDHFGS